MTRIYLLQFFHVVVSKVRAILSGHSSLTASSPPMAYPHVTDFFESRPRLRIWVVIDVYPNIYAGITSLQNSKGACNGTHIHVPYTHIATGLKMTSYRGY